MKNYKNFKNYYIENQCYKTKNKIETLKELAKISKKDFGALEDWKNWRYTSELTVKQNQLFKEKKLTELKKLLKKQIEKETKKLETEKQEALRHYENIKALGDVKRAEIQICWTKHSGAYGYQCKAIGSVFYKNNTFERYETENTGGCGYDKASTALSYFCNKLLKIVILKHDKKILNDENKHNKFYAGEPLYYQYGVGLSSYESFFKNLGYKTTFTYLHNEDIYITIEK